MRKMEWICCLKRVVRVWKHQRGKWKKEIYKILLRVKKLNLIRSQRHQLVISEDFILAQEHRCWCGEGGFHSFTVRILARGCGEMDRNL